MQNKPINASLNDPIKQSGLTMICACVRGTRAHHQQTQTVAAGIYVCVCVSAAEVCSIMEQIHKTEQFQTNT